MSQDSSGSTAGVVAERAKGARGLRLSPAAVRSAEAGLLALFFDLVAFALFGPAFEFWMGFVLFVPGTAFALAAIGLAHRAAHRLRRDPYLVGREYASVGAVTGWISFLISASYLGVLYLLLEPMILILAVILLTVPLILHVEKRRVEDDFRRALDLAEGIAECARCRQDVPLSLGRWRPEGWLCPSCDGRRWGVPA